MIWTYERETLLKIEVNRKVAEMFERIAEGSGDPATRRLWSGVSAACESGADQLRDELLGLPS